MPSCTQDISFTRLEFGHLSRRAIEGRFDGGNMASDGGVRCYWAHSTSAWA
jgi:hypothetical protein